MRALQLAAQPACAHATPPCPADFISQGLPAILTSAVEGCGPAGTPDGSADGMSPGLDASSSPEPIDPIGIPPPDAPPEVIDASHPSAPPASPAAVPADPSTPGAAPDDGIAKMLEAQRALYGQGCATCLMSSVLASQHQASMSIINNIG